MKTYAEINGILNEHGGEGLIGIKPEDTEMSSFDQAALVMLNVCAKEIPAELERLGKEASQDGEVQYVLETCEIEGWYYALVHKFDVSSYLGRNADLAVMARHLKACDSTFAVIRDYFDQVTEE